MGNTGHERLSEEAEEQLRAAQEDARILLESDDQYDQRLAFRLRTIIKESGLKIKGEVPRRNG